MPFPSPGTLTMKSDFVWPFRQSGAIRPHFVLYLHVGKLLLWMVMAPWYKS